MPVRNDGIVCRECGGSGCPACNQTGYSKSWLTEHDIPKCDKCDGDLTYIGSEGIWVCPKCVPQWWTVKSPNKHECQADIPDVPMPYGKILPDLTDCFYINEDKSEPGDDDYDDILDEKYICPNCGSDHVVILDKEHNPDVTEEQEILAERFFCISCQDSWCYEREH